MKAKRIIGISFFIIIVVLILLGLFASFLTDLWWFSSEGLISVFWTRYEAQYALWFAAFLVFLVFMNVNLSISLRSRSSLAADPRIEQFIETFGKFIRIIVYGGSFLLAIMLAGLMSDSWMGMLSFLNAEKFNVSDPIFGNDLGFYMFQLPFLQAVKTWLIAVIIVAMIGIFLVYLIRQGVSFAFGRFAVSDRARKHIAVLISFLVVVIAFGYWLNRYDILYSTRSGSFYGAGFTDVYAQLPASWIMVFVTLLCGLLIVRSLFARKFKILIRAFIAFIAAVIVIEGVYPYLMQKFLVDPNEQKRELPYIANNIAFTRLAYDLNRIEERDISPIYNLNFDDIQADSVTIRNIMLWDYRPLASTLDQLQVIRLYYDFPDVDIDRYRLPDGTYRQVMLSAREMNQNKLPQNAKTWVNLNFVYTHGYGIGMSPVNTITEEGLPEFFVKDIPPQSKPGFEINRPEFYFGEVTKTPVLINGNIEEFDYPLGDVNRMTKYRENAGVSIGSLFRRLLFAMHFGDINLLISGYIGSESKILYYRNIEDRVKKVAPFLRFDNDPYLVVANGRQYWLYDAYTTSSYFPYSKTHDGLNYIRNSVKVVIDSYNGSMRFYSFNVDADPMIKVYSKIFPELFKNEADMPAELRAHVRYPQDLFDIQSNLFETYHMEDPMVFYNKEDLWNIANEKLQEDVVKMESYYAIMRLPGEPKEEFIQMLPYTPNKRDNMIAWLCARSDGDNYGKMLVFKFPKQELTYGPMQVSARIDQDPVISQQLTLWNQQGSSVTRGHLLVIPIKEEVMYVQPVYLQATAGKLPELKRVIVSYGNRIAMEPTLDQALSRVFSTTKKAVPAVEGAAPEAGKPQETIALTVPQLSRSALNHFNRAQRHLRDGEWTKYGEEIDLLKKELERLVEIGGK